MTQERKQILKEYDEQLEELGQQIKELIERREWFVSVNQLNGEPVCKHCGNPTMHAGDVCYGCCQATAGADQ